MLNNIYKICPIDKNSNSLNPLPCSSLLPSFKREVRMEPLYPNLLLHPSILSMVGWKGSEWEEGRSLAALLTIHPPSIQIGKKDTFKKKYILFLKIDVLQLPKIWNIFLLYLILVFKKTITRFLLKGLKINHKLK